MSEEDGYAPTLVVCEGKSRTRSGAKMDITFHVIEGAGGGPPDGETDTLGKRLTFEVTKNTRPHHAGVVYEIQYDPTLGKAKFPVPAKHRGLWHVASQRAAWQTAERGEEAAARAGKEARNDDALVEFLTPLRERYWSTDALGKLAIEATLLRALRYAIR